MAQTMIHPASNLNALDPATGDTKKRKYGFLPAIPASLPLACSVGLVPTSQEADRHVSVIQWEPQMVEIRALDATGNLVSGTGCIQVLSSCKRYSCLRKQSANAQQTAGL